jgi:hypothetical protein
MRLQQQIVEMICKYCGQAIAGGKLILVQESVVDLLAEESLV